MHACRRLLLAVLSVLVLCSTAAWCQLPGVRLPKVKIDGVGLPQIPLPSVADLLKEEPPLATSLADGFPRLPLLDGWEPVDLSEPWEPVRSAEGDFVLEPGTYELELDSFCLHAGTHGPGKHTEGYLHGPYRGGRAELVRTIIRRYASTSEATRREAQALLWAVLARSDLAKSTGTVRTGAEKLLTQEELAGLGGGPWGALPDRLKRELRTQLSPAQRAVFDAEDKLRGLVTTPAATFVQLERLAVRSGNPSRSDDDVALPDRCWNLHPGGALVRYLPHGYTHMTVQVHVPSPVGLQRDGAGRIQRVWDAWGGVMEVVYAEASGPLVRQVRLTDAGEEYVLHGGGAEGTGPAPEAADRWAQMEPLLSSAVHGGVAADARDIAMLAATARALVVGSEAHMPDWAADVLDAVDDGAVAGAVAAAGRPVVGPPPSPGAPGEQGGGQPDGSGRPDGSSNPDGPPGGEGGTNQPGGEQGGGQPDGSGRPDGSGNPDGPPGGEGGTNQPGGEQGGGQPDGSGRPDGSGNPDGPPGGEGGTNQPGGEQGGGQPDGGGTPGGSRNRGGSREGGKTDRGNSGTTTVYFDPTDGMALPGTTGRQRLGISARPSGEGNGSGDLSGTSRKKRGKPRRSRPQPDPGGTSTPGGDSGTNQPDSGGGPEGNNRPAGNDGANQPNPDSGGNQPDGGGAPEGNGGQPGGDSGGNQPNGGGAPEGNTNPGGTSAPGGDAAGGNPTGGAPNGR